MRVIFIEEPVFDEKTDFYEVTQSEENIWVVVPHLEKGISEQETIRRRKYLLSRLFTEMSIENYIFWYYTPMSLAISDIFKPELIVYDCMDELSAFKFAPQGLKECEDELFKKADLVFTGGHSLYEAKKHRHSDIYPFPSSIDKEHFEQARSITSDPADQESIPHPRIGFYGVVDERMNLQLLEEVARQKPDWNLVIIGPVIKIDHNSLPRLANIHYLGNKSYQELPSYMAGWDIAMIPFELNESTRFISPTKTPEYLSAGKPVISSSIQDVIRPYGRNKLVHIADTPEGFIQEAETILSVTDRTPWLLKVDAFLKEVSWDKTWSQMMQLVTAKLAAKAQSKLNVSLSAKKAATFDYLIVGAGFAGAVLAERLATRAGKKVLIIDKRNHIGGNAYDFYNQDGILIHKYGPHIFHTNSKEVFDYLGQFTPWRPYEHRVLASVDGQLVPIPINLNTINQLYGLKLNTDQVETFFESKAEKVDRIKTSEDVVVSKVGRELYEKFFKGYTRKQWDLDPSELDASVTARVPTRTNKDDRYFTDTYQAMPAHGYTKMFEKMLSHPNIKVMLQTDYKEIVDTIPYKHMIYTGPIDSYFEYCYGRLPYRSLEFKFETVDAEQFQPTGTVNYPNEHAYTRVTDFKYLTGQKHPKTAIVYEYPKAEGDPYYPIPRPENAEIYRKYQQLAAQAENVYFVGRLATYKYYNMDQVVAQALTLFKKLTGVRPAEAFVNGNSQGIPFLKSASSGIGKSSNGIGS
jgi:UDP-galactopyranose mutase